jgi:recombinational DNA repair protein RecT
MTDAPETKQLTVAEQRDLRIATTQGLMLDDVFNNRAEIETFLKGFGITYDFFVSGLKVFLMRQAQTQPNFFDDVKGATFLEALFRCSKDGLIPDGKEAAIAIYKGVATYMPMRDGLVKILWRTGMVKSISDQVVTKQEVETGRFDYQEGDDGYIHHKPMLDRLDTDPVMAAYCVVNLMNGGAIREVVGAADLKKIAAMSRSPARATWANQMHRKAAIRRIMGKMPRTPEITQVLAHDDDNYDLNTYLPPQPAGVMERLPGKVEGEGFGEGKVEAALIRHPADIDKVLEEVLEEGEADSAAEAEAQAVSDALQWGADFSLSLGSYERSADLKMRWDSEMENRKSLADASAGIAKQLAQAVISRIKELRLKEDSVP